MTHERKRKYKAERLRAQLDGWRAELDRLERLLPALDAENRVQSERRIIALREECEEARQELSEIPGVGGRAVEEISGKLEARWSRLKQGIADLLAQFGAD